VDRDDLLILGAALGVAGLFTFQELRIAGTIGFPLDDSWIHLRFAQNLAEGNGFSYNRGVPVAGSTAPLWTLLLAMGYKVSGAMLTTVKGLGLLFAAATGVVTRRLAGELTHDRSLALAAGIGTVLMGRMAWGALSGMEVTLAAFLATLGLLSFLRGSLWSSTVVFALATLARPEAGLLFVLLWGYACLEPLPSFWRRARVAAGSLTLYLLLLSPSLVLSLLTVGQPVPATALAKVEGGLLAALTGQSEPLRLALWTRPLGYLGEYAAMLWHDHPLLLLFGAIGAGQLWRLGGRGRVLTLALLLHPLAMAWVAPYRGPAFQTGRYSSHLLPLAVAAAVFGLGDLLKLPQIRQAVVAFGLLLSLILAWPSAREYAWGVQNINAMQVELGRWVSRELPEGARLAVNDVGAIAFFSDREVIDLVGLVSPEVLPYKRRGESGILEFLERACPDYLIIFPTWYPRLSATTDRFRPIHRVRLAENHVAGGDEMVVFLTPWNRWRPDRVACSSGSGKTSRRPEAAVPFQMTSQMRPEGGANRSIRPSPPAAGLGARKGTGDNRTMISGRRPSFAGTHEVGRGAAL